MLECKLSGQSTFKEKEEIEYGNYQMRESN